MGWVRFGGGLLVWCAAPLGSCSPVCTLRVWCRVYGVLGLPAHVHRCARLACGVACMASWASWLLFTGVHALRVVSRVRRPGPPGPCSPVRTLCVWRCVYGVLGLPAPVHRRARSACGVACTASWASRLLFTGVHALRVASRVRRPGPPGSCSPVRTLCVWRCVYGVLGLPAPVHRCARPACGVVCTVSWASRLLFTGVHALRVVSRVRRPGPPGSCSPVCTPCVCCRVYGVLGLPAPVHRCARSACGVACTASWASRLLFTGVHALRVVLRVRRPGPPGSCSPVCTPCVWCRVYGVLGLPAPVHRCARSACGVARTASWASRLLFTGVPALCVVLRVRRPGPPGSCSPVRTLCVWCCVYGVLGLLAPVYRCARSVCGVACTASWASRLLFTGVHALCVVLRVRCPGLPGSCSPVRTPCVWCGVYGVLGLPAPVHRCVRSVWVCGGGWACLVAVSVCPCGWCWVWYHRACGLRLLGTHPSGWRGPGGPVARPAGGAGCSRVPPDGGVVLRVRRPGPPGSCSPVCTLCVYGVLGLPAPVHRCARPACGVAFTGHSPLRVARARWSGSPSGKWRRVLTHPSGRRRGVACTASWASRLLFSGVHALRVRCPGPSGSCSPVCTLCVRVRCPGPPGSCSPVCTLRAWWCVYGVLGLPAPVHRCARSVCGVVCTASWASRLVFTGVHAPCVVLRVPFGPFAPAWCVLCCACGVLGHLVRVLRCRGVLWCVCGVRCAAVRVRCPGPPGPCSPVRVLGVLRGVCGVGVGACSRVPYRCSIFLYTLLPMASYLFFPSWTR